MEHTNISKFNYYVLLLLFSFNFVNSQSEILELKNINLEGVKEDGTFYWWDNQAIKGAEADYSVETIDLPAESNNALKVEVRTLAEKPWFVSSSFNQKFKVAQGETYTVKFYGKKSSDALTRVSLVFQSEIKGSFQNKRFELTEDWSSYSSTFYVENSAEKNQIKFWYLDAETSYIIDNITLTRE